MKVFAAEVTTLTHILALRAKFRKFLIAPAKTFLLFLLFELFLLSCSGSDQYSRESFFDLLYELFGLLFFLLTFSLLTSMYSHSLIHILMFICLLRGIHCAFIGHSSQSVVLIYLFEIEFEWNSFLLTLRQPDILKVLKDNLFSLLWYIIDSFSFGFDYLFSSIPIYSNVPEAG